MTRRVNPALIGQLARLPGADGQDLGAELVGRFAESLVTLFPRLRELAAAGNAATLARDAHSLRGSAAMLGAVTIAELAQALESTAQSGSLERTEALITALEAEWPLTQPELAETSQAAGAANRGRLDEERHAPRYPPG